MLDVTDDKDYAVVDAEGLGLESVWRSRAVIGLGLAELGLKRQAAAGATSLAGSISAELRRSFATRPRTGICKGCSMRASCVKRAKWPLMRLGDSAAHPSAGKTSLCLAAVRAGGTSQGDRSDDRRHLIESGIRGLARMRQFDVLDKLIEQYKLDEGPGASNFHLSWLRGRRQYMAAERSKQADGFARPAKR